MTTEGLQVEVRSRIINLCQQLLGSCEAAAAADWAELLGPGASASLHGAAVRVSLAACRMQAGVRPAPIPSGSVLLAVLCVGKAGLRSLHGTAVAAEGEDEDGGGSGHAYNGDGDSERGGADEAASRGAWADGAAAGSSAAEASGRWASAGGGSSAASGRWAGSGGGSGATEAPGSGGAAEAPGSGGAAQAPGSGGAAEASGSGGGPGPGMEAADSLPKDPVQRRRAMSQAHREQLQAALFT
jgi:hypothetical protein